MATRFYFTKIAPNVVLHAQPNGDWEDSALSSIDNPVQWSWRLATTKVNAGTKVLQTITTNQQGNYDILYSEWRTYPLAAQTIGGDVDICRMVRAVWDDSVIITDDSKVRFKLYIYIANGDSRTVRHVLLDYVDTVDFDSGTVAFMSLAAAQALSSNDAVAGDVVVVELGIRVVSSPTPTPNYPPDANTFVQFFFLGANSATADGTPGSTDSSLNSWIEFSHTFTFQTLPLPSSNELCANAISVSSFPYSSPEIDCSQNTGTERELFFSFTVPSSGRFVIHGLGSNYGQNIDTLTSCGGGSPSNVTVIMADNNLGSHRSQTALVADVTPGTFIVRVRNVIGTFNATLGGGICKLSAFYVQTPIENDLYLPAGLVGAYREGNLVNLSTILDDNAPTGVAIDYTERTIDDINTSGTNSNRRVLVGLHTSDIIELLDIFTLEEVDSISDPFASTTSKIGQLYVSQNGFLYVFWFGNGYLHVCGAGTGLPAFLNAVSSPASLGDIRIIDAVNADNQPGAPFVAASQSAVSQITAPWAAQYDEYTGILYYTSGSVYYPVGGTIIKRYDVVNDVQLADFATVTCGGPIPSVRGLAILEDRSILVTAGNVIKKYSPLGVLVTTYTPSVALDSQVLIDVKATADGTSFWCVDLLTTALFKFSLVTNLEEGYFPTYLKPASLVQIALFSPSISGGPPPPPSEGTALISVGKITVPSSDPAVFQFTADGLDPVTFTLAHGEYRIFSGLVPGTYGITEIEVAGYTTTYFVTNGDPHDSITVIAGDAVAVVVTNTSLGPPGTSYGGIYKIQPLKRNDTLYVTTEPVTTVDVKIPNPVAKSSFFGG